MIVWGAFWGAVLGLLGHGPDDELRMIAGGVLGALAGWSLRRAIRTEWRRAQAAPGTAAAGNVPLPPETPDPAPAEAAPARPQTAPVAAPTPAFEAARDVMAGAPPEHPPHAVAAPAWSAFAGRLFAQAQAWLLGGNTVVRMGVLLLFIGLAFLAKYAVDNALLPPQLRLALVGSAGIGLFLAGVRLRRREGREGYALTLQGAGVAVLYLTVFAAFRLYQFLPAGAAFAALGLVCAFSTVIALAQNAPAMAFIGFAGGFAAPLLVSTGQGNHVALFGYYTLLGVAIAAVAWLKAWRALNLLGFFATFAVATLWGVLKYEPSRYASTQPFLVGFFLIYVAASLLYALRHALGARRAVDATLVFGTPIVAFSLQALLVREIEFATAFSALVLGTWYVGLGWWLAVRRAGDREVNRWLAECFAALAFGFLTLAVPLALDGRWTAAVWAVEGAGVYWMGRRQARWLARAAGLALQGLATILFLDSVDVAALGDWPLANPRFVGAVLLAGSALGIAWWSRERLESPDRGPLASGFHQLEAGLSPWLFWLGFLWWQFALAGEIDRTRLDANGLTVALFDAPARAHLTMLGWVGSAFVLHLLALPNRRAPWAVAATPAWTVLPVLLGSALWGMVTLDHVFRSGGWIGWPLAVGLHLLMLRRLDSGPPVRWWPWVHAGGVWLLVLLAGNLLVFAIGKAGLWQTAWAAVILLAAGTCVLLGLARRSAFAAVATPQRWPLGRFAVAYLWRAAAPLALALTAGALLVAAHSDGNARPLPYVPLLNPTDLAVGAALAACALWLLRLRASPLAVPAWVQGPAPGGVLAFVAFVALNTVWLRVAHHFAGVRWNAQALFDSFLVQAGYSILWAALALVLMVAAHRRAWRGPWMLGAGLLALTVLKLFVIDLSNRGGSERIVVFIAVGLLMLLVGYVAPLPPAGEPAPAGRELEGARP